MDVLTVEQRRLNMSRIRGRDTRPELAVRKALHASGLRYRIHVRELPGRPDFVFPKYRVAVFVNGCFWHGHRCALFKTPATRTDFWLSKIERTCARDRENAAALLRSGWRIVTVWECALKGRARIAVSDVILSCERFIRSSKGDVLDVAGHSENTAMDHRVLIL